MVGPSETPGGDPPGSEQTLGEAFEKAIRIMGAASQTRQGLARKLLRAGFDPAVVEAACQRAVDAGYVNDAAFAASAVARRSSQGRGTRLIARELRQKGLDDEVVQAALSEMGPDQEYVAALALAKRHLRSTAALEPRAARERVLARLYRAGFSQSLSSRAYVSAGADDEAPGADPLVDS